MATPVSVFRPHGPACTDEEPAASGGNNTTATLRIEVIEPPADRPDENAIEFEVRIPPSGEVNLVPDRQRFSLPRGLAGRTVIVWADLRSLHILLEGHLVRTVVSRLLPQDLAPLVMRYGARPAGAAPAAPTLRQVNGNPVLAADQMRDRLCPGQANHHDPAGRPPHARHHRRRFGGHLVVPDHRRAGRPPARSPHRVHSAAASALARRIDPGPATGARQRPVHGERAVHQARAPARRQARHRRHRRHATTGSCTARKNSPSGPAAAPHPSPGSTSEARAPTRLR